MKKPFYITNSIPYVNAAPHIGHALEFVQSDAIYRYHKNFLKEESLLLCGSDENALKNVQAAEKAGKPVQEFVDRNAKLFQNLAEKLNIHFDVYQKGSNTNTHFPSSQKFWELCVKNGDIYKKEYRGLYCVGCEAFYTPDELDENGECFEHPGKKLEEVSETNYFFRLSAYQDKIIKLIESDTLRIIPETRKNEMLSFLKQPLQDISISRSNERAKNWGVPVPGDDSQRLYVWFDALNIYQSGIGFGWDEKTYKKWWPADVHVIGKGIARFHTIYWPAFLLSAGLEVPKSVFVHGYITIEGQKMSKTLGNVVDPVEIIQKYGADPLRYYFLREIPAYGDGDFSESRFAEVYNADLANGLGNLVARITTLSEGLPFTQTKKNILPGFDEAMDEYRFNDALEIVWGDIRKLDKYINDNEPWKIKDMDRRSAVMIPALERLHNVALHIQPFLPETSEAVLSSLEKTVRKTPPLFPRLSAGRHV